MIHNEQFGFQKGRFTLHTVSNLLGDILQALWHLKGNLYALFIDYRKAFDLLDRSLIAKKLESMNGDNYLTHIIKSILTSNKVILNDNLKTEAHNRSITMADIVQRLAEANPWYSSIRKGVTRTSIKLQHPDSMSRGKWAVYEQRENQANYIQKRG
mgnify:CR=1 FL=1